MIATSSDLLGVDAAGYQNLDSATDASKKERSGAMIDLEGILFSVGLFIHHYPQIAVSDYLNIDLISTFLGIKG
jgi:hypothetical protein